MSRNTVAKLAGLGLINDAYIYEIKDHLFQKGFAMFELPGNQYGFIECETCNTWTTLALGSLANDNEGEE